MFNYTVCDGFCHPERCVSVDGSFITRFCIKMSWFDARQTCKDMSQTLVWEDTDVELVKKTGWLDDGHGNCNELWIGYHKEDWFYTLNGSKKTFFCASFTIFTRKCIFYISTHIPISFKPTTLP